MAAAGYGEIEYFYNIPVSELFEIAKEVSRIAKEQRVRAGYKNSRRG